jgi:NitT/TauT family transport system substrate-binding protein
MTFQEPVTSALRATGMVTTLYDLNSGESTARVLGAPFPAQSLLMAPAYIAAHPDTVQHLVNALVRTMRFINTHSAEEIAAKLPDDYFAGKDRAAEVKLIADTLPTFTKGDYSLPPRAVRLAVKINLDADFDQSVEGQWRATGDKWRVHAKALYDNRFVTKAMREIH